MAGSSELMTIGWFTDIRAAAGWFRMSFTNFSTWPRTWEERVVCTPKDRWLTLKHSSSYKSSLVSRIVPEMTDGVPGWRWGTLPQPPLSSWTDIRPPDGEAAQIHGQCVKCSSKERPAGSGRRPCPRDLSLEDGNFKFLQFLGRYNSEICVSGI